MILVYLGGGLSHHDSFDPKPDAPAEIRGKYKPIDTNVPGLQIGELLPRMAQVMDKVDAGPLRRAQQRPPRDGDQLGAVRPLRLGRSATTRRWAPSSPTRPASRGKLPPYVAVPRNPSFTWELGKSAFLGGRYESFKTGDPNAADFKVQDVSPAEPLTPQRADRRQNLLEAVDGLARKVEGNDQIATYDEFHQRAAAMILSSEARSAFAIEQESDRLRDRYGRNTFGQSCLLARRLIERGVRFVTVNYGGWDHHAKIFDEPRQEAAGVRPRLLGPDRGHARPRPAGGHAGGGVWASSAGRRRSTRTPAATTGGRPRRCCSPAPASSGGQVLGATDKQGGLRRRAGRWRRPTWPARSTSRSASTRASMLHAPDGRPIEILDKGETVKELWG